VVGVYYRPPDQGEPTDKACFLQLQEALRSQAIAGLQPPRPSAGKAAQQAAGNPGDSWNALRITSQAR